MITHAVAPATTSTISIVLRIGLLTEISLLGRLQGRSHRLVEELLIIALVARLRSIDVVDPDFAQLRIRAVDELWVLAIAEENSIDLVVNLSPFGFRDLYRREAAQRSTMCTANSFEGP